MRRVKRKNKIRKKIFI